MFVPLLNILIVPNAIEIAEMFLSVLLIADKVEMLEIGARYMVTVVSIVQIIFFCRDYSSNDGVKITYEAMGISCSVYTKNFFRNHNGFSVYANFILRYFM